MLRLLLFPLSILYDLVTRTRNALYNLGIKKSHRFTLPVIAVGNLNVGGSGKTPMIEYLIRLLANRQQVATLSRGYGRATTGFRVASDADTAQTIGDEPLQLYTKYGAQTKVVVAEDRAKAINLIVSEFPSVSTVLMDDGFQHRSVQPQLSILLTDYNRPFTSDHVLPAGNLRETRNEARRADAIVVTRSPDHIAEKGKIIKAIRKYAPTQPVFFAGVAYDNIQSFGKASGPVRDVILVTAIAHPQHLVDHVGRNFNLLRHFRFPDHHMFTAAELSAIEKEQERTGASIVTTEKDMMRLKVPAHKEWIMNKPWYYLPIRMIFHESGSEFDTLILRHAR